MSTAVPPTPVTSTNSVLDGCAHTPPNVQQRAQRRTKQNYVQQLWQHLYRRTQVVINRVAPELAFEEMTSFISNQTLIKLTASFYTVLASFVHQTPLKKEMLQLAKKNSQEIKQARIILSALIIVKFPVDILDVEDVQNLDPLGESCYNSAKNMIDNVLNAKPSSSTADVSRLVCERMLSSIEHFIEAFLSWQSQDVQKVLASITNIYEQWTRSHKVLVHSSMNEAQKKGVLNTILSNMRQTKARIRKLVGEQRANEVCAEIEERVRAEADPALPERRSPLAQQQTTSSSQSQSQRSPPSSQQQSHVRLSERKEENGGAAAAGDDIGGDGGDHENGEASSSSATNPSIAQQLAAKGIPINMRSGRNLVRCASVNHNNNNNNSNGGENTSNSNTNESNNNNNGDSQYLEEVDGQTVLNMDKIILQEASKKYWKDFGEEVEQSNFGRLFELLSELLLRIKKLSSVKHHKSLDDLLDVQFIQQTIEHGLIDSKAFYGIFYNIWLQIKSLHAPVEDKSWQQWHDGIVEQMSADDATWAELLPKIFNTFFVKLDRIEDAVQVIEEIKKKKQGK